MLYEQLEELKVLTKPLVTKTASEVVRLKFDELTFTYHPYGRRVKYWINCDNNTRLLFKQLNSESCVGETVSAEIALQLGIPCIDPIIGDLEKTIKAIDGKVMDTDVRGGILMTHFRNLKKRGKYSYFNAQELCSELGFKGDITILKCIELLNKLKTCENNKYANHFEVTDKLIEDLYKLVIFDYITYQRDRYACNIGFVLSKNKDGSHSINLAPLYDNEDSFDLRQKQIPNENFMANVKILSTLGETISDNFIAKYYNYPSILKIQNFHQEFDDYLSEIAFAINQNPNLKKFYEGIQKLNIDQIIRDVEKKNDFKIPTEMNFKISNLFNYRRKILNKALENPQNSNNETNNQQSNIV